ncbi:MAG TPA: 23S rRNA (pseudouridine(1915)-N(3))-methyltransferase RlmH [Oscillospiraceae bacterium]|nr:23S rRNA (pseudouridine(1915)-N(3))-methyltransferase RlmH [Oscillospiraceae bacterium]HXK78394.1 23S rRNA (pseudouridine(1915)-N(3))-methyltransferase RlmH [Oscillospiraceae bacterium]
MRTITILCVGNLKEKYLREACTEYEKRLSAFCNLKILEVSEERLPDDPSPAEISRVIEAEGARLSAKLSKNAVVAAMCIEGDMFSSEAFSDKLAAVMADEAGSELCFVIGGSYGLSEAVKNRAALRLSLSRMTFTHQISRILLLEQIYRAFQIRAGGKYHK